MLYNAHKNKSGEYQTLYDHSINTSKLTESFTLPYSNNNYGSIIRMYHDIGKYNATFQKRLEGNSEKYEHSAAGAYMLAEIGIKTKNPACMMLAHIIAGHHSGLPDTGTICDSQIEGTFFGKYNRMKNNVQSYFDYEKELGCISEVDKLPKQLINSPSIMYSLQFLGRMLFSALVDADFLDTENFMSQGSVIRDSGDDIDKLKGLFDCYMTEKYSNAETNLNIKRAEILSLSRKNALGDQGVYRLTVPTGGGKTLTSMAFALDHAVKHNLKHIIYIIPYINIIKQTVDIFSDIFGENNVLGHYSTSDISPHEGDERSQEELAAENWDKPIIVTTNVQFFESLHSCKASRCRKLHNIANSVLIFDEAQMLPVGYLLPCLYAIAELTKNYGCTSVLCTATQPSLTELLNEMEIEPYEICPDVKNTYNYFKRVSYNVIGKKSDEYMYSLIEQCESVLCILNSRKGARQYYNRFKGEEGVFHLSTYMTPEHLKITLDKIIERRKNKLPCKVFSTSLVEAGVDISFPYVFREAAGLDSIIQAGGRCNREGEPGIVTGVVTVFKRDEFNRRFDTVVKIFDKICEDHTDIASPEAIEDYFKSLYRRNTTDEYNKLDEAGIICMLKDNSFKYRSVSDKFELIEKNRRSVLIPREENKDICEAIRKGLRNRYVMRKASMYCVSLYENEFNELIKSGVLTVFDDIAILEDSSCYDDMQGLCVPDTGDALFS